MADCSIAGAKGNADEEAEVLWRHPDPASTPIADFIRHVNLHRSLALPDTEYPPLLRWSFENTGPFWEETWRFVGVRASVGYDEVLPPDAAMFPRPDFMRGAALNYAENLLFPVLPRGAPPLDLSKPALLEADETGLPARPTSWAQLREAVRRCSGALRAAGVRPHDHVAGLLSNHAPTVVAALASATIGAVWTGLSPDTGLSAALDRLVQVRPVVLFVDNATTHNAKVWPNTDKTAAIADAVRPLGLRLVVVVASLPDQPLGLDELTVRSGGPKAVEYGSFLSRTPASAGLEFEQLPPSHPLFVLFSSGTTGRPKAMVHTALGTLLQHKKEHVIHCSLSPSSRLLYYTTISWMLWHWSLSALAAGTSIVLYWGSPFRPHGPGSLLHQVDALAVTHFGTSAAYLAALEARSLDPAALGIVLPALQAVYSTASPLAPSTFRYVYRSFPARIHLASITGGTDIISLFGAPCPILPVRAGQVQCAGLGMALDAVDESGRSAGSEPGDLVCVRPFPSQPLTFLGADGSARYRAAYFERFGDQVWHHGDFVRIADRTVGSLVMLGRSDGVLNPSGVRFGSAEIYNVLTRLFAHEVMDAICVGRRRPGRDAEESVCLFVALTPGHRSLDDLLRNRIRAAIRSELSQRHVPSVIEECGRGIPCTANGKKIEVAVKKIVSGQDVETNGSVANPEAIEWFRTWAKAHQDD